MEMGLGQHFFTKSDWGWGNTFYMERMGGDFLHRKLRVFLGDVHVNFGHSLRKNKTSTLKSGIKGVLG